MTKDEYKINQKDKARIDGTTMGKQAIRDFVKGLKIRMDSSVTSVGAKENWENNKFAVAFWFFYKWLMEVRDFDEICDEMIDVPVMTCWVDKKGQFRNIQNFFSEEPKSVRVFIRMAKTHVRWLKKSYKMAKIRKSLNKPNEFLRLMEEI